MAGQGWLNTNLVRLEKAVLCANCEVISEGLNGHCAGCGSQFAQSEPSTGWEG